MTMRRISKRVRNLVARVAYFFTLTLPEVVFAQSFAGGETRFVWWLAALFAVVIAGSVGMASVFRRKPSVQDGSTEDLSADSFRIIEEHE